MKTFEQFMAEAEEKDPLHKELTKHYKMDSRDKAAAAQHGSSSRRLNHTLLAAHYGVDPTGRKYDKFTHDGYSSHIRDLDRLTNKHKSPTDMHVYHGSKFSPEQHFNSEGSHSDVHLHAYTSTTIDKDRAYSYAATDSKSKYADHKHMLRIHIPKGSSGGAYIGNHSAFKKEKEFLLARDSKISVNHTPELTEHPKHGKIAIWNAHLKDKNNEDIQAIHGGN